MKYLLSAECRSDVELTEGTLPLCQRYCSSERNNHKIVQVGKECPGMRSIKYIYLRFFFISFCTGVDIMARYQLHNNNNNNNIVNNRLHVFHIVSSNFIILGLTISNIRLWPM